MSEKQPTLIQMLQLKCIERGLSKASTRKYVRWVRDYVLYINREHPRNYGEEKITEYLKCLLAQRGLAVATVRQAEAAIRFMYRFLLKRDVKGWCFDQAYSRKGLLKNFFRF